MNCPRKHQPLHVFVVAIREFKAVGGGFSDNFIGGFWCWYWKCIFRINDICFTESFFDKAIVYICYLRFCINRSNCIIWFNDVFFNFVYIKFFLLKKFLYKIALLIDLVNLNITKALGNKIFCILALNIRAYSLLFFAGLEKLFRKSLIMGSLYVKEMHESHNLLKYAVNLYVFQKKYQINPNIRVLPSLHF